ncbi:hypothetical protein [Limnoglobus roseus]|uniref:Uncharacterized protein n=1 Tax=Limnoglobus roseus TaxID=2598579 RepID=A0A5C1AT81_9BACT|nr:hypothetical protein [Limnoglobus roseus]QEL18849.1 hypothetical protein PX52LOC_05890 [Limnoglobus roseus]QEL20414.1 hypothetical protein PX52LOC_07508 [Limnoglobus roseus]
MTADGPPDPVATLLLASLSARAVEFLAAVAATAAGGNRPGHGVRVEVSAHGVTVTVAVDPVGGLPSR